MKITESAQIGLIAVISTLVLTIAEKTILGIEMNIISRNAPLFLMIIYLTLKSKEDTKIGSSIYWSLIIVGVTLGIIAIYSF